MIPRWWIEFALNNATAWYLTYLLYSTLVFGTLGLVARRGRLGAATENFLWRAALLAVPAVTLARLAVEHGSARPAVVGPELFRIVGTGGWVLQGVSVAALAAAAVLALRFGRAALAERRALARRTRVTDPSALLALHGLAAPRTTRRLRLSESAGLPSPVAIGSREICVPSGMLDGLSREGVRAVLAHELAHLRRRDARWAAIAQLLERAFFVQPLQRRASRRLRETAEFVADDYAVRRTRDPEHLIDALTWFARTGRRQVLFSGFAPGSLLVRRVERVLGAAGSEERTRRVLGAIIVAGAALLAWLAPAVVPACDCRWPGL